MPEAKQRIPQADWAVQWPTWLPVRTLLDTQPTRHFGAEVCPKRKPLY